MHFEEKGEAFFRGVDNKEGKVTKSNETKGAKTKYPFFFHDFFLFLESKLHDYLFIIHLEKRQNSIKTDLYSLLQQNHARGQNPHFLKHPNSVPE